MSFAIRTASSSSWKGTTATTGPKISSRTAGALGSTGASTVGGNQKPGPSGGRALDRHGCVGADVGGDAVALLGGDQRAHHRLGVQRRADLEALHVRAQQLQELVQHQSPAQAGASARSSPGPALSMTAHGAAAAAVSRSASAKTMLADLPPSSSVTRLIVSAALAAIERPHGGRAGERDLGDVGVLDQACAPRPGRSPPRHSPLLGRAPASSTSCSMRSAVSGVSSAGLSTTVLPGGERRTELPGGDQQREVPGHDQARRRPAARAR